MLWGWRQAWRGYQRARPAKMGHTALHRGRAQPCRMVCTICVEYANHAPRWPPGSYRPAGLRPCGQETSGGPAPCGLRWRPGLAAPYQPARARGVRLVAWYLASVRLRSRQLVFPPCPTSRPAWELRAGPWQGLLKTHISTASCAAAFSSCLRRGGHARVTVSSRFNKVRATEVQAASSARGSSSAHRTSPPTLA